MLKVAVVLLCLLGGGGDGGGGDGISGVWGGSGKGGGGGTGGYGGSGDGGSRCGALNGQHSSWFGFRPHRNCWEMLSQAQVAESRFPKNTVVFLYKATPSQITGTSKKREDDVGLSVQAREPLLGLPQQPCAVGIRARVYG